MDSIDDALRVSNMDQESFLCQNEIKDIELLDSIEDACLERSLERVIALCKNGRSEDLFVNDEYDCSPFMYLCINGYNEIVDYLLDQKDLFIPVFCLRAQYYQPKIFLGESFRLFHRFSNPGSLFFRSSCKLELSNLQIIFQGYTPLHMFCHHGNLSTVERLCQRGAVLDIFKNEEYLLRTPLISACMNGNLELCIFLLEKTKKYARESSRTTYVFEKDEFFEQKYINFMDENGETAAFKVCSNGFANVLELLHQNGCDVGLENKSEFSPLAIACINGRDNCVRYLLLKTDVLKNLPIILTAEKKLDLSCNHSLRICCEIRDRFIIFKLMCQFFNKEVILATIDTLLVLKFLEHVRWIVGTHLSLNEDDLVSVFQPFFFEAFKNGDISIINFILSLLSEYTPQNAFKRFTRERSRHLKVSYTTLIKLIELGHYHTDNDEDGESVLNAEIALQSMELGPRFQSTFFYRNTDSLSVRILRSKLVFGKILLSLRKVEVESLQLICDFGDIIYGESLKNITDYLEFYRINIFTPEKELRDRKRKRREEVNTIIRRLEQVCERLSQDGKVLDSFKPRKLAESRKEKEKQHPHQFPSTLPTFQMYLAPPQLELSVACSVIGLPNLGNTCYLNSDVQCLVSSKILMSYFQRNDIGLGCKQLTLAFHELVKSISIEPTSTKICRIKTKAFVASVKENIKDFVPGSQMDAHDFLMILFEHLDTSLIQELFVGSMNCISRCSNMSCKFESAKQEPFTALTLRFPSASPCDLNGCLQKFYEEETLEIYSQCSRCGLHTVAERKLCVTVWSDILVIHLSRFSRLQEVKKAESKHIRLDTPISFPLINLNVGSESNPIVYDCVAVCNHVGSCTRGHYTAHALRGKKWFYFNDAKKPVEINCLVKNIGENNSDAYMLFYERRR